MKKRRREIDVMLLDFDTKVELRKRKIICFRKNCRVMKLSAFGNATKEKTRRKDVIM